MSIYFISLTAVVFVSVGLLLSAFVITVICLYNLMSDMFKEIKAFFTRNPCKECDYYHKANKTCHSKKCCTGGCGCVTFWDRLWCEPYKGDVKMNDEVSE